MANGLYTNSELIDTIIADLNNMIKEMINGQLVQVCFLVTGMTQKLVNLKKGITDDLKNRNEIIETLKEEIRNMGGHIDDIPVKEFVEQIEKDGAE